MKKVRAISFLCIVALCFAMTGCGKSDDATIGKWAYIHDTEACALKIANNGKLTLDGVDYKYTKDTNFFTLTDENGTEIPMRYVVEKEDKMLIYKTATYTCDDATEGSIVGLWENDTTKWSFEFTEDGEFKEDGYFPGYYTADYEAGTVKLVYNDHFTDTTIYFSIEGNTLTIEYPWDMVKMD